MTPKEFTDTIAEGTKIKLDLRKYGFDHSYLDGTFTYMGLSPCTWSDSGRCADFCAGRILIKHEDGLVTKECLAFSTSYEVGDDGSFPSLDKEIPFDEMPNMLPEDLFEI